MNQQGLEQIAERLLLPLVAGGDLVAQPPFGAQRAVDLAALASGLVCNAMTLVEEERLKRARRLCPIDRLPDFSEPEWLLTLALNDLLQATNTALGARHASKLVEMATSVIQQAGAPRDVHEVLARHSSFAQAVRLCRWDTHVRWWTGARDYHGRAPPKRLLLWPRIRRVQQSKTRIELCHMPRARWRRMWEVGLGRWFAASPLTDLATFDRSYPAFVWTSAALGLLAAPPGRTLALRALRLQSQNATILRAFRARAKELSHPPARKLAFEFAQELEAYCCALATDS
ncbi:MAG TPA: hypothetical protein VGJ84_03355 [Polyangiaceae bacterium]|jgi:hypothetical protein